MVGAKKTAKEWNSFTLTKKLNEVEREEVEAMKKDSGEDEQQVTPNIISVWFPPGKFDDQAERAQLAVQWQMQLKSGGITVSPFFASDDPTQLMITVLGLEDTRDTLAFLMDQNQVMKTRLNGNEYWNTSKYQKQYEAYVQANKAVPRDLP